MADDCRIAAPAFKSEVLNPQHIRISAWACDCKASLVASWSSAFSFWLVRGWALGQLLWHVAQKVQVGLATGTCVNDGGKIGREVIGNAAVELMKGEGELERDLGFINKLAVPPGLTKKSNLASGSNSIQKRLAVGGEPGHPGRYARQQPDDLPTRNRDLVDTHLFPVRNHAQQIGPRC